MNSLSLYTSKYLFILPTDFHLQIEVRNTVQMPINSQGGNMSTLCVLPGEEDNHVASFMLGHF